jgi:hypothetical protein
MSVQTPATSPLGRSTPTNTRLLKEFCTSGLSVASATILTNPIDVIKTRIQLGRAAVAAAGGDAAGSGGLVRARPQWQGFCCKLPVPATC